MAGDSGFSEVRSPGFTAGPHKVLSWGRTWTVNPIPRLVNRWGEEEPVSGQRVTCVQSAVTQLGPELSRTSGSPRGRLELTAGLFKDTSTPTPLI